MPATMGPNEGDYQQFEEQNDGPAPKKQRLEVAAPEFDHQAVTAAFEKKWIGEWEQKFYLGMYDFNSSY